MTPKTRSQSTTHSTTTDPAPPHPRGGPTSTTSASGRVSRSITRPPVGGNPSHSALRCAVGEPTQTHKKKHKFSQSATRRTTDKPARSHHPYTHFARSHTVVRRHADCASNVSMRGMGGLTAVCRAADGRRCSSSTAALASRAPRRTRWRTRQRPCVTHHPVRHILKAGATEHSARGGLHLERVCQ